MTDSRTKRRSGRRRPGPVLITAGVVVLLVALTGLRINSLARNGWSGGKKVGIEIKEGSAPRSIAEAMADKGIVWNGYIFYWQIRNSGRADDFKAGNYSFRAGQKPAEIIDDIADGRFAQNTVTIPEGFTADETAELLAKKIPGFSAAEFLDLTADKYKFQQPFLKANRNPTLEGYLFPETYAVNDKTNEKMMADRMLDQFATATAELPWGKVKTLGRDIWNRLYPEGKELRLMDESVIDFRNEDIVIIASIIEEETMFEADKPRVAAVLYNRLRNAWRLQVDPTVLYAHGWRKAHLLLKDLEIDSPYNTYRHKGLPPGPICNPSLSSLKAALNPTADKNMFYLGDSSGHLSFFVENDDFLKAKAALNQK